MLPLLLLVFCEIGRSTLISAEFSPLSMLDSEVKHFRAFGEGFKGALLVGKLAVNTVIVHNMIAILTMECRNNGLRSRDMIHEAVLFLGVWVLL